MQTKQVLEADRTVRTIIDAAQVLKPQGALAITGPAIVMGDFWVRLGKLGQRPGDDVLTTAILVDVEYVPLAAWDLALPILAVGSSFACAVVNERRAISSKCVAKVTVGSNGSPHWADQCMG